MRNDLLQLIHHIDAPCQKVRKQIVDKLYLEEVIQIVRDIRHEYFLKDQRQLIYEKLDT